MIKKGTYIYKLSLAEGVLSTSRADVSGPWLTQTPQMHNVWCVPDPLPLAIELSHAKWTVATADTAGTEIHAGWRDFTSTWCQSANIRPERRSDFLHNSVRRKHWKIKFLARKFHYHCNIQSRYVFFVCTYIKTSFDIRRLWYKYTYA